MTLPRGQLVCVEQTPFYHCISRCVRRSYLCGKDRFSGKDFSHRRRWIEQRLERLSAVFAIEVLAYAIMSNHYHLVLRIDAQQAMGWSDDEVERRWSTLFRPPAAYCLAAEQAQEPACRAVLDRYRHLWRSRLLELGWFMRCINEPLARFANQEDDCKGRFWEGRFRSQALLDEAAVLKCMAYVDLNPVRAGTARTPEDSAYTSIRARLQGRGHHLAGFADRQVPGSIPIDFGSYLQLIDWSGRVLRGARQGAIGPHAPPILERLQLAPARWIKDLRQPKPFRSMAMGSLAQLARYRRHLGQAWIVAAA